MTITTVLLPPAIRQFFDRNLLLYGTLEYYKMKMDKIIEKCRKKIRPQDIGKRRRFNAILKEFFEVYESKQNEEADYEAALQEKSKKRPHIPSSGGTMRFKRMDPRTVVA